MMPNRIIVVRIHAHYAQGMIFARNDRDIANTGERDGRRIDFFPRFAATSRARFLLAIMQ